MSIQNCWPVSIYDGKRYPVVSDGYHARESGFHAGVDICFRRLSTDPPFDPKHPGHDGTKGFYSPEDAEIISCSEGKVYSVKKNSRGMSVVVDRGDFAYYYQHLQLEGIQVQKGDIVKPGTKLGLMGYDIAPGANPFRHLHFEIWKGGPKDHINPEPLLRQWPMVSL